jgi:hypothetical protein
MGGSIMASIINASTSGAGGVITTADSSGILQIQSGSTTIATISSTGLAVNGSFTSTGGFGGSGSAAGILGGTVVSHDCERGGTGTAGDRMAYGNGQNLLNGLRMPFAGKLYVATLSGVNITGTVTVDAYLNGVAYTSYRLTGTGSSSNIAATGNWLTSPLSFAAGDLLGWQQTVVPSSAQGYVVAYYVVFD